LEWDYEFPEFLRLVVFNKKANRRHFERSIGRLSMSLKKTKVV